MLCIGNDMAGPSRLEIVEKTMEYLQRNDVSSAMSYLTAVKEQLLAESERKVKRKRKSLDDRCAELITEKITSIPMPKVNFENAKVVKRVARGKQYFRVEKYVPSEWDGKDVVIMTREDFEKLMNYANSLIALVTGKNK